jgi:NADPH-dependent curcumin reductase CurA
LDIYQSADAGLPAQEGDAQVIMLLNMTRSFMRGLLIQEQYGVTPEQTLNYVAKWIELVAPLLALRGSQPA